MLKQELPKFDTRNVVFFDIDGTLIRGQTQKIFLQILRNEGIIPFFDNLAISLWFLGYKFRILRNTQKIREFAYRKLDNIDVEIIDKIIEDNFSQFSDKFFSKSHDIIQRYKNQGDKIILVSASIEPIIIKICRSLNIDDYICTKLEVSNGKYTGKIIDKAIYGREKINQVKNFLSNSLEIFNQTICYNDHISDLYLMLFADIPICVNPDQKLKKIAKEKGWEIIYW